MVPWKAADRTRTFLPGTQTIHRGDPGPADGSRQAGQRIDFIGGKGHFVFLPDRNVIPG